MTSYRLLPLADFLQCRRWQQCVALITRAEFCGLIPGKICVVTPRRPQQMQGSLIALPEALVEKEAMSRGPPLEAGTGNAGSKSSPDVRGRALDISSLRCGHRLKSTQTRSTLITVVATVAFQPAGRSTCTPQCNLIPANSPLDLLSLFMLREVNRWVLPQIYLRLQESAQPHSCKTDGSLPSSPSLQLGRL